MDDFSKMNPQTTEDEVQDPQTLTDEELREAVEGGKKCKKKKKTWKQELREWIVSIAVAFLVVVVIRTFFFQVIRVDGDSMNSTLFHNERLFVTVLDVKLNGAERGDVVICNYPGRGNTNFVKRVVAGPGDSVYCKNGVTHVVYEVTEEDGTVTTVDEALDERWALYYINGSYKDYEAYTLGEDQYFVVGDNRYNSHDSRDSDVGAISGDMIVGKVRTVIWPLSEIRSVD